MREPFPGREHLVRTLRTILRREFGAADAWVIATSGEVRLEARVGGRTVVLLRAPEGEFWPRFYRPVQRERRHLGEIVVTTVAWRKPGAELAAELHALWPARAGERP